MTGAHKDLVGIQLHISMIQTGVGDPNATVTAGIIGEAYWDTVNNKLYIAEAATDSDWINEASAFDTLAEVLANGNVTGGTDIVVQTTDKITITDAPVLGTDATNKDYVDGQVATSDALDEVLAIGNTTGGTDIVVSTGDVITVTDAPVAGTDGTNKTYVDGENATQDTAIGLNTTHRASAGIDHSDVVLNNTHRTSDGSDHSFLDQSVVSGASPLFATQTPADNSTKAATTEYVDDAVAAVTIPDISCKVKKSTGQTISNNTATIATWNTETYDTDGMHDNVTNNSRITIKTAGKYHFSCYGAWTGNSTGSRIIDFLKNGTSMAMTQYVPISKAQHTTSYVGDFAVNDYVEIEVTQDSGGDLSFLSGQRYFEGHKIN